MILPRPIISLSTTSLWRFTLFFILSASHCSQHSVVPLRMMPRRGKPLGDRQGSSWSSKGTDVTQGTKEENEKSDSTASPGPPATPPPSPPRKATRKREVALAPARRSPLKRAKTLERLIITDGKNSHAQTQEQLKVICTTAVEQHIKDAEEKIEKGVEEPQSLGSALLAIAKLQPGEDSQDRIGKIAAHPTKENSTVLAHALLEAVQNSSSDPKSVSKETLLYLAQLSKFGAKAEELERRFKNIFEEVLKQKAALKVKNLTVNEILTKLQDAFEKAYGKSSVQDWYKELRKEET